MKAHCYENYPIYIVFLSNLVSLSIYVIGAYILAQLGFIYAILYLFYCFILEIRVLQKSCVNCYYYDKICSFGKGKLSALLFKKGDSSTFSQRNLSWKDMIPDMLVFIVPVIAGIILSVMNFSWIILLLIGFLLILSLAGNAFIRGFLACKYCKQRKIGCPAEKLFQND